MKERTGESIRSSDAFQAGKPYPPFECLPGSSDAPRPQLYRGVIQIAEHLGYLNHPQLLKVAMGTTALALAEFHVQTFGLHPQDAIANMQDTRNRLIDPISQQLDHPTTRREAMNQAVSFIRSTARFFQEYFEGAEHRPVAYRGKWVELNKRIRITMP